MLNHLRPAITLVLTLTVLLGLAYPLAVTGVAQALMPTAANGSLIERNGAVVGSDLIAGSDVSRNQLLYTISRVSLFFSSTYFKVVIALTLFVVGCYGIYIAGRVLLASRKTR